MALARAGKIKAIREGRDGDWFFDRRRIDAYFESLNPVSRADSTAGATWLGVVEDTKPRVFAPLVTPGGQDRHGLFILDRFSPLVCDLG